MASQSQGIQQLLQAEKRAAEKVADARKRKARRLKQAKEEAQMEVEQYRREREQEFQSKQQAAFSKGNPGARGTIEPWKVLLPVPYVCAVVRRKARVEGSREPEVKAGSLLRRCCRRHTPSPCSALLSETSVFLFLYCSSSPHFPSLSSLILRELIQRPLPFSPCRPSYGRERCGQ
ncbi:V-type proton ATPase subunit G 2 isoform X1 [Balaenoptera acutorostrata]|uniref:V-type proton ATPase subunit G n=1 Tax=Balaenoptera acutorostrata TaxID=9767 RepID=A0ABM3U8J7_BALAC|nr:V-type proton ATPase subunit G 2 isoform X1 [Balaenoptera acutorostrata]